MANDWPSPLPPDLAGAVRLVEYGPDGSAAYVEGFNGADAPPVSELRRLAAKLQTAWPAQPGEVHPVLKRIAEQLDAPGAETWKQFDDALRRDPLKARRLIERQERLLDRDPALPDLLTKGANADRHKGKRPAKLATILTAVRNAPGRTFNQRLLYIDTQRPRGRGLGKSAVDGWLTTHAPELKARLQRVTDKALNKLCDDELSKSGL